MNARPPLQSPADWLATIQSNADTIAAKFSRVAQDIRDADADERAQDEAAYWHRQELIDEARQADREALDGEAA